MNQHGYNGPAVDPKDLPAPSPGVQESVTDRHGVKIGTFEEGIQHERARVEREVAALISPNLMDLAMRTDYVSVSVRDVLRIVRGD